MTNKGTSGGKRQKGFSWHESFDEKNKNNKKGKFSSSQFPSLLPFFGKLFCGEKKLQLFLQKSWWSRKKEGKGGWPSNNQGPDRVDALQRYARFGESNQLNSKLLDFLYDSMTCQILYAEIFLIRYGHGPWKIDKRWIIVIRSVCDCTDWLLGYLPVILLVVIPIAQGSPKRSPTVPDVVEL